jgi:5-methylcytosine-specific restriction endonuclease McrA
MALWIRPEKRLAIYARDNWQCVYCGRGPSVTHALLHTAHVSAILSLDHVIPRYNGGDNASYNLVTCCRRCNRIKSTQPVGHFAPARLAFIFSQCFTPLDMAQGRQLAHAIRHAGIVIRLHTV